MAGVFATGMEKGDFGHAKAAVSHVPLGSIAAEVPSGPLSFFVFQDNFGLAHVLSSRHSLPPPFFFYYTVLQIWVVCP